MSRKIAAPVSAPTTGLLGIVENHLFAYVNDSTMPEGHADHRKQLRGWLDRMIAGKPPTARFRMGSYLELHLKRSGKLALVPPGKHSPNLYADLATMAALFLWDEPERRRLLRRCPQCQHYFIARRPKMRFCEDPCRRTFYSRKGAKASAYMRSYRQKPAVKKRS